MRWKRILFFFHVFLLTFSMTACGLLRTPAVDPPSETIVIGTLSYGEVSPEKVQALSLAVDSCVGLEEIGEIDEQMSTIDSGMAYKHPDPRYPNLAVVLRDGTPVVFQFCNFLGVKPVPAEELKALCGMTRPDSILKITVSRQRENEKVAELSTVENRADLDAFYDCFDDLSPIEGYADSFPVYFFDVELTNGFSFTLDYRPKQFAVGVNDGYYTYGDAMGDWIYSHISQAEDGGR